MPHAAKPALAVCAQITAVMAMQGMVLLIAIGLVFLARKAIARRWIV